MAGLGASVEAGMEEVRGPPTGDSGADKAGVEAALILPAGDAGGHIVGIASKGRPAGRAYA